MKISPRNFTNFDAFADAVAHAAIQGLPVVTDYDGHKERIAKLAAIRDAMDAAKEKARDKWEAYCDHMEDLYERGVGPSWE